MRQRYKTVKSLPTIVQPVSKRNSASIGCLATLLYCLADKRKKVVLTSYILPLDTLTVSSGTPKRRILSSDATGELGGSSGKLKLRATCALCVSTGG